MGEGGELKYLIPYQGAQMAERIRLGRLVGKEVSMSISSRGK